MEKEISLHEAVRKIVSENGINVLSDVSQMRILLRMQGITVKKALTVELILTSCPAVVGALKERKITRTEANVLVGIVMRKTSFSPVIVREVLGELMLGVGINSSDYRVAGDLKTDSTFGERLSRNLSKKGYKWSLIDADENAEVSKARMCINYNNGIDHALSELDRLAAEGNAEANYALGEFQRENIQTKDGGSAARRFYELAAKLGYGPAFGALADLEIRSNNGSIEKAAKYLCHPIALEGSDGKKWRETIQWMAVYSKENIRRIYHIIMLAILAMIIGFLYLKTNVFLGGIIVIVAGLSLIRAVFARIKDVYQPQMLNLVLITVSWLAIVFSIL